MDISSKLGLCILKKLEFNFPHGELEINNTMDTKNRASPDKSADFLVSYIGESRNLDILVEVKLKQYDSEEYRNREKILSKGEIYKSQPYKQRDSKIDTILKNANKQLKNSSKKHKSDFNILLFIATSYEANINSRQLINSLYGITELFNHTDKSLKFCYFYKHNEFKRKNSIDCVLIAQYKNYNLYEKFKNNYQDFKLNDIDIICCLNPFSEKLETIKKEFISKIRQKCTQIINPEDEIIKNNAYCLDETDWEKLKNIDKYEELIEYEELIPKYSPRVQYLLKKYGTYLIPFQPNNQHPTFTIRANIEAYNDN